jgi:signal transduction histidine kinase/transcriptional regulator with GAF, ATPase, and Fis domain
LAIWSFSDQLNRPISSLVTILSTSIAIIYASYFDFITTHQFSGALYLGLALAGGSLIQIAVALPVDVESKPRKKGLNLFGFAPTILVAAFGIFQLSTNEPEFAYLISLAILVVSLFISGFIFGFIIFRKRIRGKSPLVTRRSENFILAALISITPLTVQWIVNGANMKFPAINPLFIFPFVILPATMMRLTRNLRINRVNKQIYYTLIFIIITVIFGLIYTALVYLLNQLFMIKVNPDNPIVIGSMVMLTILLLDPLRKQTNRLLNVEDESHEIALDQAMEYATAFTSIRTKKDALLLLRDATWEIVKSGKVKVYIYDPNTGGFGGQDDLDDRAGNENSISATDPLSRTLIENKTHLFFRAHSNEVGWMENSDFDMDDGYSHLFIPIWGNYSFLGWIEVIDQNSNPPYTEEIIQLIETLASQFALVYERCDTLESVQQSLREMEILNQISLAVNIQSDLDQLLQTIFDQLNKFISLDRLSLVRRRPQSDEYQRVFLYQDNAVQISTKYPRGLPETYPEMQALKAGKPTLASQHGINWFMIPLEQEGEQMGVLSLGSELTNAKFDQILLNLSESIANLVTSAIIKFNLMEALRGQMRHLEKLNAVSQQLTSTLKMEPLLEKIVRTATDILHAESGSILTPTESQTDLEIRIATGEGGDIRLGRTIPVSHGIAGIAFSNRQANICNDDIAEKMIKWDDVPDALMMVKNILAVPLIVQDEAIGVLEIFNKANDQPFTKRDAEILQGFAAQAAIALNNAKKYAKADQALEKRIDELTTLQRIDKDLHSSRTLAQALQTALNAALAYTKVEDGSIMLVDTYNHELDDIWQKCPNEKTFSRHPAIEISAFPWFSDEMDTPYEVVFRDPGALSAQLGLEDKFQAHFIITSKLEDDLYSLLILHLEDANLFDEQDVDFLLGLNNHALIAIRNAILIDDLSNAINAKNEFISFISHELKNPLTAIKGHADVLAKGIVGEINSEQEDFLKTISHNVRRMSTFITDLSDQAQIESKSLRFVFDTADVFDLTNEVLQSYGQQIKGKSLVIKQNLPMDLPKVWCDRQRLIQVFSNLVSNAIKYTPDKGTITISAEHTFNDWDPKGAAEVVHITVEDTGYGIDYEDQPYLFTKFFRGTNEDILKIPGTGLGLRISKSITEMMGGTMWFESEPGKGSTFHFTVPI